MKSIVFSINKKDHRFAHTYKPRDIKFSIKRFFSLYYVEAIFFLIFIFGIVYGSFSVKNCSKDFIQKLDFLFVTNLSSRVRLSVFSIFCSTLASNFIFIFISFLFAFSAWGIVTLPLLCAFKGYGVGISSAYLFSQYSVTGIGFYILVILPGTVLFLFSFLMSLKESEIASFELFKFYFTSKSDLLSQRFIKKFLYRYSVILVLGTLSSVLDVLLWMLFANMFSF